MPWDVSDGLLSYAKSRIDKVKLYLTHAIQIPLSDRSATPALSCHVLQLLDSTEDSIPVFGEIHLTVVSFATMMIDLPIYNSPLSGGLFKRLFKIQQWISCYKALVYRMRMY